VFIDWRPVCAKPVHHGNAKEAPMALHGSCETCKFFIGIDDKEKMAKHGIGRPFGECHRNPPTVLYVAPSMEAIESSFDENASDPFDPGFRTKWPIVPYDEACGEFVMDA